METFIFRGKPVADCIGKTCVIDSSWLPNAGAHWQFIDGKILTIKDFKYNHGLPVFVLDTDNCQALTPIQQATVNTYNLQIGVDGVKIAKYGKDDILMSVSSCIVITGVKGYDKHNGFVYNYSLVRTDDDVLRCFRSIAEETLDLKGFYSEGVNPFIGVDVAEPTCRHENKYKNVVSANLKFWVCPDCGADLGDIGE